MDSLDQYIQDVVTKDIYEPEDYIRTIRNSINSEDKHFKYFNLYKVAIIVICLMFTSGIAYAAYNYVKNNFNRRKGIETAINNGYIMNVDGEPVTSNDVSLSINQILLDDYNLDICFGLKFNNVDLPENIQSIKFENILISDDNNNILYFSGNKDIFDSFVKSHNLKLDYKSYNDNYINSSLSVNVIKEENDNLNLACNFSSYASTFPKSTKFNLYIENISLIADNSKSIIPVSWRLESPLVSNFQNRKSVNYTNIGTLNENIVNIKVVTYTTGTNIEMELKTSANINDSKKLKELIEEAIQEQESNSFEQSEFYDGDFMTKIEKELNESGDFIHNYINNIYIENAYGEKFYITNNVNSNKYYSRTLDDYNILYTNTLDMTTYNCTNFVTLHFTYNSEEYSIYLKCSD